MNSDFIIPSFVAIHNPGSVTELIVFNTCEEADDRFMQECQVRGVDPVEEHYNQRYMHLEDGTLIVLGLDYLLTDERRTDTQSEVLQT